MEATDKAAEDYFRQVALDRAPAQQSYRHILTTMDTALSTGEYDNLWALIPYIESGDGHPAYQYIGKTHRFLRILNIIMLENKYRKILFCQGCYSADALWEKYMLTLFAFRRLLFRLSEESFHEAVAYLQSHPISHFAAYMMVQDELIIPDQAFYLTLASVYEREWSPTDMQQYYALTGMSPADSQQETGHE